MQNTASRLNVDPEKPHIYYIYTESITSPWQALRYKIWDLGLASKSHDKGKIWAFGTNLGLFWDHFWTFPGLLSRYFHENAKNVRKGQNNALSRHFPFQNISNGQ